MGAMRPLQPPVVMITHGDNTDSITRLDHATDRQDKRRRHGGRRLHPPLSPFHLHHHHSRTGSPGPLLAILMLLLTSLHFTSSMQSSLSKESNLFSSSQVNKAEASSPELLSVIASNSSVSPNRTHHPHLHHHKHLHHNKHNSINAHHHNLTQSTNVTSSVDYSKIPDTLIGHHLDSHLHLLEPLNPNSARDSLLPFQHLPHPPPPPPRQESSSSSSSSSSDQQLLPTSMDGSSVDFNLMTAKGLKFEEEPSDSYIVRSKSAILRCKTLNALNAWFSCNSGDERKIQSNQKISNYVDPEKGIRMIEVDLEVTRSDVEEHTNSGYTNPFECWCTAYGGQHQIMSRKASVSFSYLKRHFYNEPLSKSVPLGTSQIMFDCLPPEGEPSPVIFWMKGDVIIAESHPRTMYPSKSNNNLSASNSKAKKYNKLSKSMQSGTSANKKKLLRQRKSVSDSVSPVKQPVLGYHPEGHESFPDPYKNQNNDKSKDKSKEVAIVKAQTPKPSTFVGDEEEEDEYDDYDEDDVDGDDTHTNTQNNNKKHTDEEGDILPLNFDEQPATTLTNNYLMTHDHSLVIKQVTADEQGNYTCGVRNPAGVRFSASALLTVFVNGEWSNWGSWSPCHLPAGAKCGRGTQKRVRHCSNPGPVNNCPGDPVQVVDCNVQCSSNVDEYGWSAWSVWSPCAHDCTQVRRRVCNNPRLELDNGAVNGGVGATLNCLGHDYMVKNCTGGLCRKLFDPIVDPNRFPIGHEPIPIGPQPVPGPTTSLTATTTNEQIYFVIIFVLILIILLCILFIGFKFLNRRRHRGAKSGFHSGVQNGGVWSDMVQLERGQDEDAQAMLLMLQQQQNQLPGSNVQLQMSGLGSAQMARFQNGTGRHQIGGVRSLPFNGTTSSSSSGSSIGNGSTNQPEKYQLISRLKGNNIGNSNKPNLLLDHLLLRGTTADSHPPLPTIPSINSLNSYATNGSMNKYEEPIFPNGTVASMILRSPHPGAHYLHNSGKPPLPPVANQPTPSALSNTSGSNNTATISTNTTNTSESENNESEPDYAEPMINYAEGAGSGGAPRPPSVPPPSISCSTPLLPRSMASNALNNLTVSTGSSSTHSPHHPPLTFPTPSTSSQPPSSASPEIAFGKHEKFIKLTTDLLERGHYSMMPNLGVGIYLTPGFMIPDYRMANSQQSYYSTSDLYLRYGIDTAAKLPTSALLPNNNYCTLSSVVTVAFSKSPGTGAPPPGRASAELLSRPFVLCFKHCIATRGNSVANLAKILSGKNLVVLWQDFDPKNSGSSIWTEIVCYGEENLNTACYLEFDANYVYLVSKFVGRYLLCIKSSDGALATRMQNADSMMLASPQLGPSSPLDFSKLVNFSLSIEQFSSTEHLVKVYCYDNLPSSTLNLRNELAPSSGASSCNSSSSIRLRLGKNANTCALRLCSRGGPICFELKPPDTARHRIKGMRRVEIPLAHLWYSMNSSGGHGHAAGPVHCSFVVMNNHTVIRECTRKQCSSGIYENEFVELDDEDEFESDSDDLVTEEEQESLAEESRPLRGNSRNSGGSSRLNTNTNHNQLDHYHESEHDLNYEVKVWQLTKPGNVPGGSSSTPISNVVLLNSSTTVRLCHPANTSPYYVERSLRHLFTETDLEIRDELIERLNMPRSDQLDWRTLASAAGFDHYLPYFASQPSPATSILELWEAKILNQLVQKRESSALKSQSSSNFSNANSSDLSEIKDIFYSKLVHLLQSIQRADLIEIILSNQC